MISANAPAGSDDRIGRITTVPSQQGVSGEMKDWRLGSLEDGPEPVWVENGDGADGVRDRGKATEAREAFNLRCGR